MEGMSKAEIAERKLIQLLEIHLDVIEGLYKDVAHHIDYATTSTNNLKIVKNVPQLKMNINGSRQKVVVTLKSQIRKHKEIVDKKYGPGK